jgi:hypothetical protein
MSEVISLYNKKYNNLFKSDLEYTLSFSDKCTHMQKWLLNTNIINKIDRDYDRIFYLTIDDDIYIIGNANYNLIITNLSTNNVVYYKPCKKNFITSALYHQGKIYVLLETHSSLYELQILNPGKDKFESIDKSTIRVPNNDTNCYTSLTIENDQVSITKVYYIDDGYHDHEYTCYHYPINDKNWEITSVSVDNPLIGSVKYIDGSFYATDGKQIYIFDRHNIKSSLTLSFDIPNLSVIGVYKDTIIVKSYPDIHFVDKCGNLCRTIESIELHGNKCAVNRLVHGDRMYYGDISVSLLPSVSENIDSLTIDDMINMYIDKDIIVDNSIYQQYVLIRNSPNVDQTKLFRLSKLILFSINELGLEKILQVWHQDFTDFVGNWLYHHNNEENRSKLIAYPQICYDILIDVLNKTN